MVVYVPIIYDLSWWQKTNKKTQMKTFQSLHLLDFILHQTKAETITHCMTIGLIVWALSPLSYTKKQRQCRLFLAL